MSCHTRISSGKFTALSNLFGRYPATGEYTVTPEQVREVYLACVGEETDLRWKDNPSSASPYNSDWDPFEWVESMTFRNDKTVLDRSGKFNRTNAWMKLGRLLKKIGVRESLISTHMSVLDNPRDCDEWVITGDRNSTWLMSIATTNWQSCHDRKGGYYTGNQAVYESPCTAMMYLTAHGSAGTYWVPFETAPIVDTIGTACTIKQRGKLVRHEKMQFRSLLRLMRHPVVDRKTSFGVLVDRMFPDSTRMSDLIRVLYPMLRKAGLSLFLPSLQYSEGEAEDLLQGYSDGEVRKVQIRTPGTQWLSEYRLPYMDSVGIRYTQTPTRHGAKHDVLVPGKNNYTQAFMIAQAWEYKGYGDA